MKELFAKMPEMINAVLERAMNIDHARERPASNAAKKKLMASLRRINAELQTYAQEEGEGIPQEQLDLFLKVQKSKYPEPKDRDALVKMLASQLNLPLPETEEEEVKKDEEGEKPQLSFGS